MTSTELAADSEDGEVLLPTDCVVSLIAPVISVITLHWSATSCLPA